MANSENTKLSMFIKMGKNYKIMILFRNLRCVCKILGSVRVTNANLKNVCFSKDNIEECEHVTEMIRKLSWGINGLSRPEITDILAYISTN